MSNPEKQFEQTIEEQEKEVSEEEKLEKIKDFEKEIAKEYRKEGIPVDNDIRINIDEYSDIFGEAMIKSHKDYVERMEKEWYEQETGLKNRCRRSRPRFSTRFRHRNCAKTQLEIQGSLGQKQVYRPDIYHAG